MFLSSSFQMLLSRCGPCCPLTGEATDVLMCPSPLRSVRAAEDPGHSSRARLAGHLRQPGDSDRAGLHQAAGRPRLQEGLPDHHRLRAGPTQLHPQRGKTNDL